MNNRSLLARAACGLLLAAAALALTGCKANYYQFPQYNFAGRTVPPSLLSNRAMVAIDNPSSFAGGALQILDAERDLRNNVQNTIAGYAIAGYSGRQPTTIFSYPEQELGYVYGSGDGSLVRISYATEASLGAVAGLPATSDGIATLPTQAQIYSASGVTGGVIVIDNTLGREFALNLPGAQHVIANTGGSVVLVTVRNTNTMYRVLKLVSNVLPPAGTYSDCEPLALPVYCLVPVAGTFDRPVNVVYSLDGSTAYVLDCGRECGGVTSGITALNTTNLNVNSAPLTITGFSITGGQVTFTAANALTAGQTVTISGLTTGTYLNGQTFTVITPAAGLLPTQFTANFAHMNVAQTADSGVGTLFTIAPINVTVPGGATIGLTDGVNLYVAGQQLNTTGSTAGYFSGIFSIIGLASATPAVTASYSIPDGTHTTMLFADDSTLWIGSTLCTTGARGYLATLPANATPGAINLNCLARYVLGSGTTPQIVPTVTPGVPVGYPNQNNNQYYYGDMTGMCWIQNFHKIYTAYGGQVHAFNTIDGSERDNTLITVQGTAENVVYMDATTNAAN